MDKINANPLLRVSSAGNVVRLNRLLNDGADPNQPDKKGKSPLMIAAEKNNGSFIKALLNAGANPNNQDDYGKDALMYATRDADYWCVKQLLEAGAEVNVFSKSGNIAIGYFVMGHCWQPRSRSNCTTCPKWRKYFSSSVCEEDTPPFPPCQRAVLRLLLQEGSRVNTAHLMGPRGLFLPGQLYDILNAAGQDMYRFKRAKREEDYDTASGRDTAYYQPMDMGNIARDTIRTHLLKIDPTTNLFLRVPNLGIPTAIARYVLLGEELLGTAI